VVQWLLAACCGKIYTEQASELGMEQWNSDGR